MISYHSLGNKGEDFHEIYMAQRRSTEEIGFAERE